MELHPKIKPILEDINFLSRYKKLNQRFPLSNEAFENYSNEEVLKIFDSLGYNFKYAKKEKFFGLKESINGFDFTFNISCKCGVLEFIWGLTKDGERFTMGGPWGLIGDLLVHGNCSIKDPSFKSYAELKEILAEALMIYEDFKKRVIREVV